VKKTPTKYQISEKSFWVKMVEQKETHSCARRKASHPRLPQSGQGCSSAQQEAFRGGAQSVVARAVKRMFSVVEDHPDVIPLSSTALSVYVARHTQLWREQ